MSDRYEAIVRRWATVADGRRTVWHVHRAVELVAGVGGGVNGYGVLPKYRLLLREAKMHCSECHGLLHPRTKECKAHQAPYGWEAVGVFFGQTFDEVCAQAAEWLDQHGAVPAVAGA